MGKIEYTYDNRGTDSYNTVNKSDISSFHKV